MHTWYVYLIRCADDSLYCGITKDIERRLAQHNGHKAGGARYTRSRRPVSLCAVAPCDNHSMAAKLESRIKALPRQKKIVTLLNSRH